MVAACITGDEAPPVSSAAALSFGECQGLPVEAFIEDALVNLGGVDPADPGALDLLLDIIGLGTSAEGIFDLVSDLRAGVLDVALWPSLADLSAPDAERTIAAAIIEIDPDFQLQCGLLSRFSEGPPRTVTDLALIVNQSHGFPVSDEEMLTLPFERKSLLWEIATALDRVQGIRPPGGRHGVNASPDTEVESPLIQLLAAFRGAHRAFFGRERPWAHRPFGRGQESFDRLVYLLGEAMENAAIIGPEGGVIVGRGSAAGTVVEIPAGALEEPTLILIEVASRPVQTAGHVPLGTIVRLSPEGLALAVPATLVVPLSRELARLARVKPEQAQVAWFDVDAGSWALLPSELVEPHGVRTQIDHFSLYQAAVAEAACVVVESLFSAPKVSETVPGPLPDSVLWSSDFLYVYWTFPFGDSYTTETLLMPSAAHTLSLHFTGSFDDGELVVAELESMGPSVLLYSFEGGEIAPEPVRIAGHGFDSEGEGLDGHLVQFGHIRGLARDSQRRVYVAEERGRIRRIDPDPPHRVWTVAGTGERGFNGDQPADALSVMLDFPRDVRGSVLQMNGELLLVADTGNHRIRALNIGEVEAGVGQVTLGPGEIVTIMGSGEPLPDTWCAEPPDPGALGGTGLETELFSPQSVTAIGHDVVVADSCNNRLLVTTLKPRQPGPAQCDAVGEGGRPADPCLPVTLLAGTGEFTDRDGLGPEAGVMWPAGLSYDPRSRSLLMGRFWGGEFVRATRLLVAGEGDCDWEPTECTVHGDCPAGQVCVDAACVDVVPVTVTAPSLTITYGDAVPDLDPIYDGFVDGDGPSDLDLQPTCETTYTAGDPVGEYTTECSGGSDARYEFVYVSGTLTVTQKLLTIAASDASKPFGDEHLFDQASDFTVSGLEPGDTVTSVTLSSDGAAVDAELGTYTIVAGDAVGTGLENYEISYVNGTLTVTAGPASIIVLVSGAEQSGEPSAQLSESLVVLVSDAHGNPTQNVAVTWQATGGAWVSPETTLTDAAGNASVTAYLGPSYDTIYTYWATVEGFPLATSVEAWSVPSEPNPWEWTDEDELQMLPWDGDPVRRILPDYTFPLPPSPLTKGAALWEVRYSLTVKFVYHDESKNLRWTFQGDIDGFWGFARSEFRFNPIESAPIRLTTDYGRPFMTAAGSPECHWEGGNCSVTLDETELVVLEGLGGFTPFMLIYDEAGPEDARYLIAANLRRGYEENSATLTKEGETPERFMWPLRMALAAEHGPVLRNPSLPCYDDGSMVLGMIGAFSANDIEADSYTGSLSVPINAQDRKCDGSRQSTKSYVNVSGTLTLIPIFIEHPQDVEDRANRTAESQFVYDNSDPGALEIEYRLSTPEAGLTSFLEENIRWRAHSVDDCFMHPDDWEVDYIWPNQDDKWYPVTDPKDRYGKGTSATVRFACEVPPV